MVTTTQKKDVAPKMEATQTGKEVKLLETGTPMGKVLEEQKQVSAQDRIKRAEQFAVLATRHDNLLEKKSQLAKFILADDGTQGCNLVFKSRSTTFEISNSGVIKDVLSYATIKLDSLLEISEAEVLNFNI